MSDVFGIRWRPGAVDLTTPPHLALDVPTGVLYLAVAVVTALLARRRPSLGLAALVVLVPFAVARYVGPTTITLFKAGVVGVALGLAARRLTFGVLGASAARWLLVALAVNIVAVIVSALAAGDRFAVAREAAKECEYAVIFLVALLAYAADPDDRPVWWSLRFTVAVVCVGALAQYLVGAHSGIVLGGRAVPRIAGPLEGPNQLAGYLDVVLPLLFARNLLHRDGFLAAVLVVAAAVDLLTFSRAGILGAIVGCAVVLSWTRVPRYIGVRFAVCALIAIGALAIAVIRAGTPDGYFSLAAADDSSTHLGNRAQLWSAALALWHHSPFTGVGAGNFELDLPSVGLSAVRTHANSLYLQSLAETGAIGLASTIGVFVAAVITLARSPLRRPVIVGAVGATVALALHQVFDDLFFFPKVASTYWLVLGIAVAEVAAQRIFEARRLREVA